MKKVFLLSSALVMLFLCYTGNTHATSYPDLDIYLTAYVSNEYIDFGNMSDYEQYLMYNESWDNYNYLEGRYDTNPIAMAGDYIFYFILVRNHGRWMDTNGKANDVRVVFQNDAGLTLNAWWHWESLTPHHYALINLQFGPDQAIWAADYFDLYDQHWLAISSLIDPDYDQNAIVSSALVLTVDIEENLFDNESICEISIVSPVPEPATLVLLGTGLAGLVGYGRKKLFKK